MVTGLSDYVVSDEGTAAGPEGSAPIGTTPDGATPDGATSSGEADTGPPRPSYCAGISFYASYDTTLDSAEGDKPASQNRVTLAPDAGVNRGAADFTKTAAVYYPIQNDAAPPRWTKEAGSVAFWIKQRGALASSQNGSIVRQSAAAPSGQSGGPALSRAPHELRFGLSASPAATLTSSNAWRDLDWNHLVGTWVKTPGAFTLTLNGGAAPSGARAELKAEWDTTEAGNFLRFGSDNVDVEALVDDFAWWTRALTAAEIAALVVDARAGRPIGIACGLP